MSGGRGIKAIGDFFSPPKKKLPTANEIYSGPRAFSNYRTEGASAGNEGIGLQRGQLGTLDQIAKTGWSSADQGAQRQAQRQAAQGEQAQRGAVMQNAAARGQLNGGMQFAGAMAAQQGAANRAAASADSIAQAGADRRFGATQAIAGIGQGIAGQQMQQAQSQDQFNQFAAGMQAQARTGEYDAQKANQDSWWHRMSGGMM